MAALPLPTPFQINYANAHAATTTTTTRTAISERSSMTRHTCATLPIVHTHTHKQLERDTERRPERERGRTAKVVLCLEPKCCVLLQHVGETSAADLPQLNHINKGQQQQQWCFAKLLYQLDLGEVKCNYLLLNKLATILIPSIGSGGKVLWQQLTPALNSNNNCAALG